jgi:hypothetical protein
MNKYKHIHMWSQIVFLDVCRIKSGCFSCYPAMGLAGLAGASAPEAESAGQVLWSRCDLWVMGDRYWRMIWFYLGNQVVSPKTGCIVLASCLIVFIDCFWNVLNGLHRNFISESSDLLNQTNWLIFGGPRFDPNWCDPWLQVNPTIHP